MAQQSMSINLVAFSLYFLGNLCAKTVPTNAGTFTTTTSPPLELDVFGICYGPAPLKNASASISDDDFMAANAKPLWGSIGAARGDLALMRRMGASAVRLYGNNPDANHESFLNAAFSQRRRFSVIPGISDYPYTQMVENCVDTAYDCFSQVKDSYFKNLQNGFLRADGTYHPSLKHIIVMNEPDMKLGSVEQWCKAMVSAVDAMLEAEKLVGVKRTNGEPLLNFTVTVSFTHCKGDCLSKDSSASSSNAPALGQMLALQRAFLSPESVNYTSVNDLGQFYYERFINSFNTRNKYSEVRDLFMVPYPTYFPTTPYMVEEYHPIYIDKLELQADLQQMWNASVSDILMLGYNFFEFQRRYDKDDAEEIEFGMFALGDFQISTVYLGFERFPVWCLEPVLLAGQGEVREGHIWTNSAPEAVASVFAGNGLAAKDAALSSCYPDAWKVMLDEKGFSVIQQLQTQGDLQVFIRRVVKSLGASIVWEYQFEEFTSYYTSGRNFSDLVSSLLWMRDYEYKIDLSQRWLHWFNDASCLADRSSDVGALVAATEQVCELPWAVPQHQPHRRRAPGTGPKFSCSADVPQQCTDDAWSKADYILSSFQDQASRANPLVTCYWNGAARIVPARDTLPGCVVSANGATTPLTQEGWQAIRNGNDPDNTILFLKRVLSTDLDANYTHGMNYEKKLDAYAPYAVWVRTYAELKVHLLAQPWVCGDQTGRLCESLGFPWGAWRAADYFYHFQFPVFCLMMLCFTASICAFVCTRCLVTDHGDPAKAWFDQARSARLRERSDDDEDDDDDESEDGVSVAGWRRRRERCPPWFINLLKDPDDDYVTY